MFSGKSIFLLLTLSAGICIGIFVYPHLFQTNITKPYQVRQSGYKYINPLLECEDSSEMGSAEFFSLKARLEKYANSENDEQIAIYFRDLNNGPWVGINEKMNFDPASLLKVPILLAYYKEAEKNPQILQQKIIFENPTGAYPQNIKASVNLQIGESYSVDTLLERMITKSDNDALYLLSDFINQKTLDNTYQNLGLDIPGVRTSNDYLSVKNYASFFRILYNASYLNRDMSERALKLLSQVEFKEGLVAGVDQNIVVSHKFGERLLVDKEKETRQLHDCGIVYYPEHPYLLCIMTRGNDFSELQRKIKDVSKITYEEVKSYFSKK